MKAETAPNIVQQFHSPSGGVFAIEQAVGTIVDYIHQDHKSKYAVIVGTDSEQVNGVAEFVSVIVVHRIGAGGRYFWSKQKHRKKFVLRDRIYKETILSLELGQVLLALLKNRLDDALYGLEIHIDVGENGKTKDMIKEVVGMVKGNGFEPKIKPYAYGATKVADRHV